MKFAAIQMNSASNVAKNLITLERLLSEAKSQGAQYCLLPENFAQMPINEKQRLDAAEVMGSGIIQDFLSQQAKMHNMSIIAGGMAIWPSDEEKQRNNTKNRVYNTSLVFNNQGKQIAYYRKQHLFDVALEANENSKNKAEAYSESDFILAGRAFSESEFGEKRGKSGDNYDDSPLVESPLGKIGLSICYDLRFAEYFRMLSKHGMSIMTMPAAFTKTTGFAHWEVLLRARAIENQVYVVAAGQTGMHDNGRETFGHSMIIDPWGEIVDSATHFDNNEGVVVATLSTEKLISVRQQVPCLQHRRY